MVPETEAPLFPLEHSKGGQHSKNMSQNTQEGLLFRLDNLPSISAGSAPVDSTNHVSNVVEKNLIYTEYV